MTESLEVLVLESEPAAADATVAALTEAGHTVHRCHDPGPTAFGCHGLETDHCPLDGGTVDVAITVRARPRSVAALAEDGVTCALQHRIPLLVAGNTVLHPFGDYVTTVVAPTDDVVAAVEATAKGSLRRHEQLATEVARRCLQLRSVAVEPVVNVVRQSGIVTATIRLEDPGNESIDRSTRDMVATRVHGALRQFDRHARQIDVAVG